MRLNGSIIAFRTDASRQIGTGHVMRCLTLAEALRKRNADCHFICRTQPDDLLDLIRLRGFPVWPLPQVDHDCSSEDAVTEPPHAAWLQTDQKSDALETLRTLDAINPNWLVVDHYAIDYRWEEILRKSERRLMVIDDLADRRHDCDLLLDQNLGRDGNAYAELLPPACEMLMGERYALLRPEFAELRKPSLQRRTSPRLDSLLVSMGGVDKDNNTSIALAALTDCPIPPDCRITVVMGSGSPSVTQVEQLASSLPWATKVLTGTDEMARIMSQSDLAIGACGVTGLERACLGLPSIMLETADNQAPFLAAFEARGLAVTGPGFQYLSENDKQVTIQRLFRKALNDEGKPMTLTSSCDGLGSERVADAMAALCGVAYD